MVLKWKAYLCSAATLNGIRLPLSEPGRCHVLPQELSPARSSAHTAALLPRQAFHWLTGLALLTAAFPPWRPWVSDTATGLRWIAEYKLVQIQPVHTYSTLLSCNEKERMKLTGGGWERTYECIITMDVLCKLLHSPLLSRCVFIFQVALELLPEAWTGCPEAAAPQKPCRIQRSVWDRISCTCPTPKRHLSAPC